MATLKTWVRSLLNAKKEQRSDPSLANWLTRSKSLERFATNHNNFAFALYRQLLQRPGNVFLSPFSIRTIFGMAYAGAKGETAAQIRDALHFQPSDDGLHLAFAEIIQRLRAASGGKYEMAIASSLWGQNGASIKADFLELVASHYGGSMHPVDFRHATEAARKAINRWIGDKTKQKIKELIPSGGLDTDTFLVLANAVYFKGKWVLPFWKDATRKDLFYLENGRKVETLLMHESTKVRYMRSDTFQAVDLRYQGGDLSMLVLLSGINGHEPPHEDSLFISSVFHKAFVEVNEEGRRLRPLPGVPRKKGAHLRFGSHRRCPSSELITHSCLPSAISRAAQSCFSDGCPIQHARDDTRFRWETRGTALNQR